MFILTNVFLFVFFLHVFNQNNALAIALFDKILQKFPSSPRSLYGKALALDDLADKKRSNEILEKALQLYEKVLKADKVPTALFNLVADRCINRLRFLGNLNYFLLKLLKVFNVDRFCIFSNVQCTRIYWKIPRKYYLVKVEFIFLHNFSFIHLVQGFSRPCNHSK